MKLFYRTIGEGKPIIILHGLFGQSDNWNTLARQFSEQHYKVITADLRNHGLSPHNNVFDLKVMSQDVKELIEDNNLENVILMGHSLGGKVAMQVAVDYPQLLSKLIVVDIAPRQYPVHHQDVLKALNAVDFKTIKTRKEAEEILNIYIKDFGTKQFLLKNIFWKTNETMDWRFNLKVIEEQIENVGTSIDHNAIINTETLFIRGENSNYINDNDIVSIQTMFPNVRLETIANAGHWVHAENPAAFYNAVMKFI